MDNLADDASAGLTRLTRMARERLPTPLPLPDGKWYQGYELVQARLAQHRRRRGGWRLPSAFAAAAAGAALLFVGYLRFGTEPALVAAVDGAAIGAGQAVSAPAHAERRIQFSDGTDVTLDKAARSRVAAVGRRGARIRLDGGRARVRVVPRKNSEWLFHAGPCEVHVTGTSFDMNWSEDKQRLEVDLFTGSVTVRGPAVPSVVTLKAGQRLVMDLRQGVSLVNRLEARPGGQALGAPAAPPTIVPLPTAPASTVPASTVPPAVMAMRGGAATTPAEGPRPASATRPREARRAVSWTSLVRENEFARVLEDARRQGIDAALSEASAADMVALGDAARLTGETALARRALLAVRVRFPTSPQADRAAFLLGLIAEDMEGDAARALEWYRTYLVASPNGPFAAEALGHKMTLTLRLQGAGAARAAAIEYLARFPRGAYAPAAERIVSGGGALADRAKL